MERKYTLKFVTYNIQDVSYNDHLDNVLAQKINKVMATPENKISQKDEKK
jgi:hypothetical protein